MLSAQNLLFWNDGVTERGETRGGKRDWHLIQASQAIKITAFSVAWLEEKLPLWSKLIYVGFLLLITQTVPICTEDIRLNSAKQAAHCYTHSAQQSAPLWEASVWRTLLFCRWLILHTSAPVPWLWPSLEWAVDQQTASSSWPGRQSCLGTLTNKGTPVDADATSLPFKASEKELEEEDFSR